jgi:NADH dehydrogenase
VKILVTGGTGFVGHAVVHELRAQGRDVRALVRDPGRAERLANWHAELVTGDVTNVASLATAMVGCSHVVHLVAIIRGSDADFERVMVSGTQNVIAAARDAGVERLVLMSALGVDESSRTLVPYYGAKWQMEQDVKASGLEHVILRPSFVFGAGGGALPTFVRQVRLSPVVTVIGDGTRRLQPIWLDDAAAHVAAAVDLPAAANRAFELGGPDAVSWNELYRRIARTLGKHRTLVHVPFGVARSAARLTGWIPRAPLTADQVTMLEGADSVVGDGGAAREAFGLPLLPLDEQLRRAVA